MGRSLERAAGAPLLLLFITVAIYGNSLGGPFLLDDRPAILENPAIRQLWPPWGILDAPADAPGAGRPVVGLSLAINYAIGGYDVTSYHVLNIAIHALAGLALFGVARRTFLLPRMADRLGKHAGPLAFSIALLWLVHPLQTEPVNYVIQRSESLMGLFALTTLYLTIRVATDRPGWRFSALATLACAAGMASKEAMVGAPLAVLLYDRAFLAGSFRAAVRERRGLYTGLAATWLLLGLLMGTADYTGMAMGFDLEISAMDYVRSQPAIVLGYLWRVIWPHPLIADYGQAWPTSWGEAAPALAVMGALVLTTLLAIVRSPRLGFLGAWFFCFLAPSSSFIPIISEVGAERRMYTSLATAAALAVVGSYLAWRRAAERSTAPFLRCGPAVVWSVVGALALTLAIATVRRNHDYRSVESIWRTVIAARPGWRAHVNLGAELFQQGRFDEAVAELRRSTELGPNVAAVWSNLGSALTEAGRVEESLAAFRRALELDPERSETHNNLAISYGTLGRHEAAFHHFEEALRLDPSNDTARENLDMLRRVTGG